MPARVLVVDDEPDVCWAIEIALREAGHDVVTTGSGSEALSLLVEGDFEVALVDAKLGDMDGFHLAREAARKRVGTALVLVSAYYYIDDKQVQQALEDGLLSGFIAKPFSLDEMRRVLADLLADRRPRGGG